MKLSKQLFLWKWQTHRRKKHNWGSNMQKNCSHKSMVWFSQVLSFQLLAETMEKEGALQRQVKDCTPDFTSSPFLQYSWQEGPEPVQYTLSRDAFPVYNPVPHGYSSKSISIAKVTRGHGRSGNPRGPGCSTVSGTAGMSPSDAARLGLLEAGESFKG